VIPWGREDSLDRDRLLYAANRSQWRAWLKKHYRSEKEVWLVFYKKHSGKARIAYNDAVEEALCFGWIDSTVRRIDEDTYAQRFSPRRPKSRYSQANLERVRALAREGKVAKEVLAALGDLEPEDFVIPPDILESIKASGEAWKNFQGFSPSYQRIRIAYIDGARKRPEEFRKRLSNFIRMTEKNRQFGFGGIEKYY
jgi:uncharacterized protein YdeI (YjbR/CyaY-like superfamily)